MVGVNITERDESLYSNSSYANPCLAVIGTATKGPIGVPTLCVSQKDLKNKFGVQTPDCIGLYAANFYLAEVNRCYYVRVAGDTATSAVFEIPNNGDSQIMTIEMLEKGTFYNEYTLTIEEDVDISLYKYIILKDPKGVVLEKLHYHELRNGSVTSKYFKISKDFDSDLVAYPKVGVYSPTTPGEDDLEATSEDYVTALDALKPDTLRLEFIITPGMVDQEVIQKGLEVASSRGDCLYFVDPPSGLDYDEAIAWHNGKGEDNDTLLNSSYGALYWSWQYIYDEINNQEVLVPPSVVVPPAFARGDAMSKPWYAPAGLTRGLLKNVLRSEFVPDSDAQDLLYTDPNNINPIITHSSVGLAVFGQKTLWRQPTSLNRVNVRRLITYIKHAAKDICQYLVFEPNDSTTWNNFQDLMDPILRNIKVNRGLYDYKLVKVEDVITDNDIDNYTMPVQILIKPTKSAEYIPVDIVLVATGTELQTYGSVYNE